MAYEKQGFVANETIVTAAALNHMEDGIARASEDARQARAWAADGRDLSEAFGSASALVRALAAEDYADIRVGDYWPLPLSGAFRDYGAYTVPAGTTYYADAALTAPGGATAAALVGQHHSATAVKCSVSGADAYCAAGDCLPYYERTLNNAVIDLEVAAVNGYWRYGEAGDLIGATPHLTLVSRACLPFAMRMRKGNDAWEDAASTNPWTGSALYRTLNDPDHGLVSLIAATDLGAHLYAGPNGGGMRALLETKGPGAAAPTGWGWRDRGRLFLPTEAEVWGHAVFANNPNCLGLNLQWPLFAGTRRHISKGLAANARAHWWTASTYAGYAAYFCYVNSNGNPSYGDAAMAAGVPVCCVLA